MKCTKRACKEQATHRITITTKPTGEITTGVYCTLHAQQHLTMWTPLDFTYVETSCPAYKVIVTPTVNEEE
jgi:hypothetical protein